MTDRKTTEENDTGWKRRTVLKVAGAGAALPFAGAASAKGHGQGKGRGRDKEKGRQSGNPNCECADGATLLAKYAVKGGSFVFEKGRDSLNIDGSEVTFSDIETKENGEILSFDWDSGIYDVTSVCAKAGPNTYSFEPDSDTGTSGSVDVCENQERDQCHAVSSVVFCKDIYWQVDFGRGPTESPPSYDDEGEEDAVYMAATSHPDFENPGSRGGAGNENLENFSERFTLSPENGPDAESASVTFELVEDFPYDGVHLAAWEMPGPYKKEEDERQVQFDDATSDTTGESTSLTVALPTTQ